METGRVIANVSQSIDHDFCSAAVDHARNTIWVFCSAFGRRNKEHPGPCSDGIYKGCYVGAWKASLTDLTTWSTTAKSLTLPDGVGMANNDVTFVSGSKAAAQAKLPGAAPAHQAAMIIEQDRGNRTGKIQFAVNTGTDGDLSKNWILLNGSHFHIGKVNPADGEGTGDAPAMRYDVDGGHYYSLGGGWITNGPVRSTSLAVGSWEVSPRMPMAVPVAVATKAKVPAIDRAAGINTELYTNLWKKGIPPVVQAYFDNISAWNYGVTDPDICCSDGYAPSYMIHTLSQQGGPKLPPGTHPGNMMALGVANATLFDWLRSYFPPPRTETLPPFRVMPSTTRGNSTQFAAWVRTKGSSAWTPAPVLQTTAKNKSVDVGGCGYFSHLSGWTASWISLEISTAIEVRVQRLGGAPIGSAAVHPASSNASVVSVEAGASVIAVPEESRFVVDFDGTMDDTDTGPTYKGRPIHTFSVFANELDPNPPAATDPGVTAIAPGDPLPPAASVTANTTLLFLPGEHRPPAPDAAGWAIFTLPSNVRVHVAHGAILYAALESEGKWGAHNVTLEGLGVLSGEEMHQCPNRTDPSQICYNKPGAACTSNISPQGITLRGVTRASVTGVTFVDFPNHHLIMQATDCATSPDGIAGVVDNVKVLGWRANGDGLHVFGSWRVRRLFMRTQDDSMYLSCGQRAPGCAATTYARVTTWNDANGAAFCFTGNGTTLSDSDVIYARASWEWWDGGRVFSQRGKWPVHNVTVSNVRLSDPLPSMNTFQLKSTGGATDLTFKNVNVAALSTALACPNFGGGCNCVPKCGQGPLPDGMPNLLTGIVRNVSFNNVTIRGASISTSLFTPAFNISNGTVTEVYVDGHRMI
jgi:hypothetical protein